MTINPEYALSPKSGHGTVVRLSWGLVQIPVRLYIVADDGSSVPARSMFTADAHPVGMRKYDKITGETVEGEVVKKVLMGDGWVDLTDDEIAAHSTLTKGIAEIEAFIPLDSLGTLYVTDKAGAWMPDKMTIGKSKVTDPGAAKAAALLRKAMAAQEVAALVLVPTTAGGKYVALLPDGQAAWLVYADKVRAIADTVEYDPTDAEMSLAEQLIDNIGVATPVLVDHAGELLRTYLDGKARGEVVTVVATEVAAAPVDLLAALTASVTAATKARPKKTPAKKAAPLVALMDAATPAKKRKKVTA